MTSKTPKAHKSELLSAQVLMKTKHGQAPTAAELTAERIASVLPAQAQIDAVAQAFATAGFQIGPVLGMTFSIVGPQKLFQTFFHQRGAPLGAAELPLGHLPAALQRAIAAVVISAAPEFGPGGGFS